MIFCELLKNPLDRVLFYNMYMHNMFKPTHSHVAALIVKSIYPFPCKTSPFFPEHKIKHLVLSIGLFRTPNRSKLHERRRKKICRTNKPRVGKKKIEIKATKTFSTPYDATFAFYACRKNFIPSLLMSLGAVSSSPFCFKQLSLQIHQHVLHLVHFISRQRDLS